MGLGLDPNKQGNKGKSQGVVRPEIYDDGVDYDNLDYSSDVEQNYTAQANTKQTHSDGQRPAGKKPAGPSGQVGQPGQGQRPRQEQGFSDASHGDQEEYDDLEYEDQLTGSIFKSKAVIVVVALVVLLIIFFVGKSFITKDKPDEKGEDQTPTEQTAGVTTGSNVSDTTRNTSDKKDQEEDDENAFELGVPSYTIGSNDMTAGEVNADPEDFVRDLNGKYVETNYEVVSFDYVYDYVNYKTYRAVMDDGLELYWLDVVYNKRNYRIQIPYYRYVALKGEGICRVEIEVLTLVDGSQIISYMQVVDFME